MSSFDELKSVMRHSAIYAFSNILAKFIGFLMIPVYTRFLSPADYGVIELLDMTVTIISTFVGLNFSAAVLRFYYACRTEEEKKSLLSTALTSVTVLAVLVAVILSPLKNQFALALFKSEKFAFYFPIILATIVFQVITDYCLTFIQIRQQSLKYAAFSIVRLLIGLSLNIFFVVIQKRGPAGIIYSSLVTCFLMGSTLGFVTYMEVKFSFSRQMFKKMVGFGAPLIVTGACTFVLTFSDRYFLNHFAPLSEVGIYSLGYKIAMMIGVLVMGPFFNIWNPKRFELAEKGGGGRLQTSAFAYFLALMVMASLALSIFIPEILWLVATPPFYKAASLVPVIVLGYIFYASYFHFRFGIYLSQKTVLDAYIWGAGAGINLLLNYFLIRAYSSMGAAVATMSTYFLIAIATHLVSRRLKPIKEEYGRMAIALFMGLTLYGVSRFLPANISPIIFGAKTMLIGAFPIGLYFLGYYSKDEIAVLRQMAVSARTAETLGRK